MVSVFGWPDPNTGFDQSEHALYTRYFIMQYTTVASAGSRGVLQYTQYSRLAAMV